MSTLEYLYTLQYIFEWYANSGQDASSSLCIDNLSVNLGFPENANVPDPTKPNAIIYGNLLGATLPMDTRYTYSDSKPTVLPTPKATEGYTFLGWYTDAGFTTKIEEISPDTEGQVNVFARWHRSVENNFDEAELDISDTNSNVEELGYRTKSKDGAAFKTVDDGSGGKYLLWTGGVKDPQFQINGSLRNVTLDKNSVTYFLKIARDGENPVPKTSFTIRESGSATITVFSTTVDGEVLLGGKSDLKICDLTNAFISIIISVDFDAATATVYNPDGTVATNPDTGESLTIAISKPAKSTAETLVDFIDTSTLAFCWYMSADTEGGTRALRIDDIRAEGGLYSDDFHDDNETSKKIVYEGLNGAEIPADAPTEYDPLTDTYLPKDAILDGKIFTGWYTDAAYTERVEYVPSGTSGNFTVYARWANIVFDDFETTEIAIENPDGASSSGFNPNINGFGYRINKKAGAAFKIAEGSDGKYLVWSGGTADPAFLGAGSLADILGGLTAVTYSLDIALGTSKAPIASTFRIQESGSKYIPVFSITKEGDVLLCGNSALKIGTISDSFTNITVTVDFEAATATVYNKDGSIATNPDTGDELVCTIAKPTASEATDLVDFIGYTANLFYWYAGASTEGERALCIDNISVIPGKTT